MQLDELRAAPATLESLIDSCPAGWLHRRPAPDKWSVAEIAAHLADDELVLAYRMRTVLADDGAAVAAFDQDRWAAALRYNEIDPRVTAARYRATREWNLATLESLTPEELERHGIHSQRGRETIASMAAFYAGHDRNHFGQIRRILALAQASSDSPGASTENDGSRSHSASTASS